MNRTILFIVSLCASLCPMGMYAQETAWQMVSIDEMFSLADQNSKSLRPFLTGVNEAQESVKTAKNARLPEIGVSFSFSYLGDAYLLDRDFSNGTTAPMPHFGNNFMVEASQVIYAGGAISNSIEIAKLQKESAELGLETARTNVRFLLVGYYLELFKQRNMLRVYEKNIEQTKQVLKDIRAKGNEGIVLKNDITRYDLLLANLELACIQIRNTLFILNNNLVITLGLSPDVRIEPDTTILSKVLPTDSEGYWADNAFENSPELKQSSLSIQIVERQDKIVKSDWLPKVALFAGNYLDGPITFEVPPIDKNINYWCAGVNLSYNISSLYKTKQSANRSKLTIQRTREQYDEVREKTGLAIKADYVRYLEAYEQLKTQQKSVELANQNYTVISNRYKNDMALITDMLDASSSQLNAELQLANARINIIFNYYKLKHTSGNL